jgi:hypothetical protein
MDESFMSEHHLAFDGQAGVLFDKCIEDAACAGRYWHALTGVLSTAKGLGLSARASELDTLLAPWQVQEQGDGRFHHTRDEAHAAATETGEFAMTRVARRKPGWPPTNPRRKRAKAKKPAAKNQAAKVAVAPAPANRPRLRRPRRRRPGRSRRRRAKVPARRGPRHVSASSASAVTPCGPR